MYKMSLSLHHPSKTKQVHQKNILQKPLQFSCYHRGLGVKGCSGGWCVLSSRVLLLWGRVGINLSFRMKYTSPQKRWAPVLDTACPSPSAVDPTSLGRPGPDSPGLSTNDHRPRCGWQQRIAEHVRWDKLGLAGTTAIGKEKAVEMGRWCKTGKRKMKYIIWYFCGNLFSDVPSPLRCSCCMQKGRLV